MFDPKQFAAFARACQNSSSATEAAHRTAISRAYYAAFLMVRSYCQNEEIPIQGSVASSHQNTLNAMWDIKHHDAGRWNKELKRLKARRESADYDLSFVGAASLSENALDDADALIRWVESLPRKS